jgi:hypothetical protein
MGLNPNLEEAMKMAVRETILFITQRFPKLSREEAYMIASVPVDPPEGDFHFAVGKTAKQTNDSLGTPLAAAYPGNLPSRRMRAREEMAFTTIDMLTPLRRNAGVG